MLRRLGHYQGSMIWYLGEWFWGVDRLDHLERSLTDQGLNRDASDAITYTRTWADLTSTATRLPDAHPAAETTLEVFFSIRSPYSYLGLERAIQLADAWNTPLQLRPVLPMVMRGQSVPDAKKWYIFHDTKREADKLGIPYGFVADPLGPGVERCYALFEYARSPGPRNRIHANLRPSRQCRRYPLGNRCGPESHRRARWLGMAEGRGLTLLNDQSLA